MILRNQGVSRYLSPHRAPSEAAEALSFSPALTIWCWMLLVPQSISLPSPLLRRSISKARYSKQGRALRERQGRDLFKSCPRPAETPLIRHLTPASHDCSRFPRLGAPALTLIPLFTSPPPFFPLCTDGSFLASGGRWPRPSPRTGHCSPLLRKWNPSPRRRRRAREGVCGRRWSWLQPRRSRDRCGCRYRSPAGSEAPWTSVARGEGGFRPPSHLEGC